jgi:hypothetical protein
MDNFARYYSKLYFHFSKLNYLISRSCGFCDQSGHDQPDQLVFVASFEKIQFFIVTSEQFFFTRYQFLMTSGQFHVPRDQLDMTSDLFEKGDDQNWSQKPQDP